MDPDVYYSEVHGLQKQNVTPAMENQKETRVDV